jgi:hypothetical protein
MDQLTGVAATRVAAAVLQNQRDQMTTPDFFPRAEHRGSSSAPSVGLTAAILSRLNVPVVRAAQLGWMSEQWLDEHRASRET